MSSRTVGGIKSTSGLQASRSLDGCLSKSEEEVLRQSLHDSGKAKGWDGPKRKPNVRRDGWMPGFIAAVRRTGSERKAAKLIRVGERTIRRRKLKRGHFLLEIQQAHDLYALRQILKRHPRIGRLTGPQIAVLVSIVRGGKNSTTL